ncbi:imidazolonepropionase-like amidohydrolase [Litorimonas taeanensis]|uniref:Imidazolonepropionase-like amidohydrolase n=1 Tax=Litorimonas taeanensis TaxID=568099 RepID=A0A420WFC6_9PROT|nr:amidohydrolase family protein [Litorimonas taeanensis]RKQ69698.1 imidazolonepropionase-like amidohydrolase [Litorimonas taeanensis]
MTYRTLLTSAAAIAFFIGGIGVAFNAFAQNDTQAKYEENYEDYTLIHAGHVLAVPGQAPIQDATIIIHKGKIVGVEKGFLDDEDATILDKRDMFFLPGLIDSHVHLRSEWSPTSRWEPVTMEAGDRAFQAAKHAKTTLMAGFTAVQDVGGPKEIFALKRAINAGLVPGPHIQAAGSAISVSGGHGDAHGFKDDLLHMMRSETVCDGPSDCRRAVRQAVKNGADVIKITATGGVLSNTNAGTGQQFFDDELKAIVEAATKMGRKVTAHAHGKTGIESALKAGVQSIEHGTYLDATTARLFKRYDATLVPTIMAGMTVVDWANNSDWLPPNSAKKALEVGPQMQEMASIAYQNGIKIAFGTDTGVSKHGDNAQEFKYLIKAGMSEQEAIASATTIASKHIGLGDVIGTLEGGKYADVIGVYGNPLNNIEELLDVDFVMKGGIIYKNK